LQPPLLFSYLRSQQPLRCLNSLLSPTNHSTMATSSLQTFHLFPDLPLELQTLIWTFTMPGPQFVTLHREIFPSSKLAYMSRRIDYDREKREGREAGYSFTSSCCPPVLLHVCQYTGRMILSTYERCFTLDENQESDLSLWYQALIIFSEEWGRG
jgi:hypothetical protein